MDGPEGTATALRPDPAIFLEPEEILALRAVFGAAYRFERQIRGN